MEKKKDLMLNYKHLLIQSKVIEEMVEINEETKGYLEYLRRSNGFII